MGKWCQKQVVGRRAARRVFAQQPASLDQQQRRGRLTGGQRNKWIFDRALLNLRLVSLEKRIIEKVERQHYRGVANANVPAEEWAWTTRCDWPACGSAHHADSAALTSSPAEPSMARNSRALRSGQFAAQMAGQGNRGCFCCRTRSRQESPDEALAAEDYRRREPMLQSCEMLVTELLVTRLSCEARKTVTEDKKATKLQCAQPAPRAV